MPFEQDVMQRLKNEQLRTLIDINNLINSNYTDIDALLIRILESAMRLVDCEAASLLLSNKDDTLTFEVALGPKGAEAKKIIVDKDSIAGWVSQNKKTLMLNDCASDPRFFRSVQESTGYVSRNMLAVPMSVQGECIGVIEVINKSGLEPFNLRDLALLELLSNQVGIAYMNADKYRAAQNSISVLSSKIENGKEYHSFIAKSPSVENIIRVIKAVAKTNSTILITGESGVGKELFAEQIHLNSPRYEKPFVRVNCAALSSSLLESELFGHVKGAFTDALADRAGRFETADGGTIFLDEIGELPLDLQAKLLRVLQERRFEKVGSSETISVDVRIVAATNRNLEKMVSEGSFRSDLFYRLNVVPIEIPPLRERKEDIEPMAEFFLRKFCRETKKNFKSFSRDALKTMFSYAWPGNVRELENSVERACVLGVPPVVQAEDLGLRQKAEKKICSDSFFGELIENSNQTLKFALNDFKKRYIAKVLSDCGGNQTRASEVLGVGRTYLSRLMSELSLKS